MANPGGGNQFGNYTLQPAYGDVKKQTELLRQAPMSGAPLSGRALNAPRQAQRSGSRPAPAPQPAAAAAPAAPTPDIHPQAWGTMIWQHLAQVTGDPLVQQYAQQAAQSGVG